jgi:hypothetical protein
MTVPLVDPDVYRQIGDYQNKGSGCPQPGAGPCGLVQNPRARFKNKFAEEGRPKSAATDASLIVLARCLVQAHIEALHGARNAASDC